MGIRLLRHGASVPATAAQGRKQIVHKHPIERKTHIITRYPPPQPPLRRLPQAIPQLLDSLLQCQPGLRQAGRALLLAKLVAALFHPDLPPEQLARLIEAMAKDQLAAVRMAQQHLAERRFARSARRARRTRRSATARRG